jgi:hypothetical protein
MHIAAFHRNYPDVYDRNEGARGLLMTSVVQNIFVSFVNIPKDSLEENV